MRNDGSGDERDYIRDDVENLIGGNGDDTLTGGAGANVLEGGPGADTFNGSAGSDTASYERHVSTTSGVNVSLDGTRNDGLRGENDLVGTDVENVTGSRLHDVLLGDDGALFTSYRRTPAGNGPASQPAVAG